jgi:hypothetical protein
MDKKEKEYITGKKIYCIKNTTRCEDDQKKIIICFKLIIQLCNHYNYPKIYNKFRNLYLFIPRKNTIRILYRRHMPKYALLGHLGTATKNIKLSTR